MFNLAPRFSRDTWELIERKVPQPARRRLREFRIEQQVPIDNLRMEHMPAGLNLGEMPSVGKRHSQPEAHQRVERHRFVNAFEQFAQALAGERGREHDGGHASGRLAQGVNFGLGQPVYFVEHMDTRPVQR